MKIFDFDKILDTLTNYLETRLELFKIEVKEEISTIISRAVIYFVLVLVLIVAMIFGLGALAIFLNNVLENDYYGFLIVFVLTGVVFILILRSRQSLERRILDRLNKESGEKETNE